MISKQAVYQQCVQIVQDKISMLQSRLQELKESVSNETKSTAGDKHETARAHLQLEQEQINAQLAEVLAQQSVLEQINPNHTTAVVVKGSLIKTSAGVFFMSIAAGKMKIGEDTVIALSQQSPLGMKLIGLEAGASTVVNGRSYEILRLQ